MTDQQQQAVEKPKKKLYGKRLSPLYKTWENMIARCHYESSPSYKNYGGRGITVCFVWKNDFYCFENWALANGWEKGLQIDRIDTDLGYSPSNCRFVTHGKNQNNKKSNIVVEYNGVTYTATELARLLNMNDWIVRQRIRRGWSVEKAISEPVKLGSRAKR